MTTDLTGPSSAPTPLATRLAAVTARRRHLDGQVASLQAFEQRLTEKVRVARATPGRPEQVRELMTRLLGVRARLQESFAAQTRAAVDEDSLRAEVIAEDERVAAEDERREQARREAEARRVQAQREANERREFELACLRAVTPSRDGSPRSDA